MIATSLLLYHLAAALTSSLPPQNNLVAIQGLSGKRTKRRMKNVIEYIGLMNILFFFGWEELNEYTSYLKW